MSHSLAPPPLPPPVLPPPADPDQRRVLAEVEALGFHQALEQHRERRAGNRQNRSHEERKIGLQ